MRYIVLDVETSDIGPDSGVVEIAWAEIDPTLQVIEEVHSRIDPEKPINPAASGVHGITNADVADEPTLSQFFEIIRGSKITGPMVIIGHNCVPGDTEVLTPAGWVRISAYVEAQSDALVMQWDPGSGALSWTIPTKRFAGETQELLVWDTKYHQGAYTRDHRMYIETAAKSGWRAEPAGVVAERGINSVYIPVSGVYTAAGAASYADDVLRFVEAIRANGSWRHLEGGPPMVGFTLKKPRKIARLLELAAKLGLKPKIRSRLTDPDVKILRFKRHEALEVAYQLLGRKKRYSLQTALQLDLRARLVILDESRYWDGHDEVSSHTVSTIDEEEAAAFQLMAHLSGWSARVTSRVNTSSGSSYGTKSYLMRLRPKARVKTIEKPALVKGLEKVYCLQVETGAFLMRRNQQVNITGNCAFDLQFVRPWIDDLQGSLCTLRLSRRYFPDSPNAKLATLKYYLNLSGDNQAHSALGDVRTTVELLRHLVFKSKMTLKELAAVAHQPVWVPGPTFGKFKGKPWCEVPNDYLRWLASLSDLDMDLRFTLERLMKDRAA
jgi:DNA polymerase III epsilon subunit-like protein